MDISEEPQFGLDFFDPLSNGTATTVVSIAEIYTGTQWRRMSHYDGATVFIKFAQLILQLVVIDFAIGVEGREQHALERNKVQASNGFCFLEISTVLILKPVVIAQYKAAFGLGVLQDRRQIIGLPPLILGELSEDFPSAVLATDISAYKEEINGWSNSIQLVHDYSVAVDIRCGKDLDLQFTP